MTDKKTHPAKLVCDSTTAQQVERLGPWFHNLHLPDGTQTAPDHFLGDFPNYKWNAISKALPEELKGWTVLDIGCNAGFYSFELARRGAVVTAIDLDPHYLEQARWAAKQYDLSDRIEFRQSQVYDLARSQECYDLVLFLGVFYHLRYPLLGLDIVAAKTRRLLLIQTLTMPGGETIDRATSERIGRTGDLNDREPLLHPGWPKMVFFEHGFAGDPTNWWCPNAAAVEAMVRSSGMRILSHPTDETYLCGPDSENPHRAIAWNSSEYLSAIGEAWMDTLGTKVGSKGPGKQERGLVDCQMV